MSSRKRPNILITGTPGVGKTTTAALIAVSVTVNHGTISDNQQERLDMQHVNVGELISTHKCYDGRDESLDTNILDEDKLLDAMEVIFEEAADEEKGIVADFHMCDFFPERWFDLVLVLRTSTESLYDRLTKRGYNDKKREENMQCEIMQTVLDEAREAYRREIVHEVPSTSIEDMESNVERVKQWREQWITDNS